MKLPPTSQQKSTVASVRTAFTLVELLVVIAIIIVLVSLLMVGVFKALDTAYEAQTRTDITQIAAAIESFKTKYQVSYIPSRLVLCKQTNYYYSGVGQFKSQLHQDSFEYLNRIWPRLGNPLPGAQPWNPGYWNIPQPGGWLGIDWDNSGSPAIWVRGSIGNAINPGEANLEGDQCLVFFLGGIQPLYVPGSTVLATPATVTGFSTNQSNPAQVGGDRVPPFFEFKSNRLVSQSQWAFNTQGGNTLLMSDFYSYLDGYGKFPYAYFSSYKTANGYNRYFSMVQTAPWAITGISDCQSLGVWPYAQSGVYPAAQPLTMPSPVYLNSQTFQLISAGKRTELGFGPGTVISGIQQPQGNWIGGPTWTPSNPGPLYQQGFAGYDDIANFYDRLLGVPTQ
jgi:type II secretory pathway pseudopilin PulG